MMDDLPEGWAEESLAGLTSAIQYGYTASAEPSGRGPRLLRITDIQNGRVDWTRVPGCTINRDSLEKYRLNPGDIVFARSGATTGKSFFIRECPKDAVFASYLIRVRARQGLADPAYLSLFFQSQRYWEHVTDSLAGNAQPNCNGTKLGELPVILPPLAEQRRIVSKVELLLAEVNAVRARLAKVPTILKCFRQSLLAAACSGRLTQEWRNQGIEGDVVSRDRAVADDLPTSWSAVQLRNLTEEVAVGHVGPMASEYVDQGIPFLRSQNVREFRYEPLGIKFITRRFHEQLKKSQLGPGDVVIVRSGNAGVACVVPWALKEANCADLVVVRPSRNLVAEYLCLFINSSATRTHVEATKVGIAQGHFNIGDARKMVVSLPPIEEQREIVSRTDALFALADAIEFRVTTATARADKLTQSVLAKAFRGELVPTEADLARHEGRDYEPAAALLGRIQGTKGLKTRVTPRGRRLGPGQQLNKRAV